MIMRKLEFVRDLFTSATTWDQKNYKSKLDCRLTDLFSKSLVFVQIRTKFSPKDERCVKKNLRGIPLANSQHGTWEISRASSIDIQKSCFKKLLFGTNEKLIERDKSFWRRIKNSLPGTKSELIRLINLDDFFTVLCLWLKWKWWFWDFTNFSLLPSQNSSESPKWRYCEVQKFLSSAWGFFLLNFDDVWKSMVIGVYNPSTYHFLSCLFLI